MSGLDQKRPRACCGGKGDHPYRSEAAALRSGTESGTWYGVANRTAVDDVVPPSPPGWNHTDTLARASTSLPFKAALSSVSWWGMLTAASTKPLQIIPTPGRS